MYNVLKEFYERKEEIKNSNNKYIKRCYCLKCRGKSESKTPEVVKTKNGRIMLLSECELWISKKSKFIKEQEAKGLLIMVGKIPILGSMNEIINIFLLAGDTFMPKMHLK